MSERTFRTAGEAWEFLRGCPPALGYEYEVVAKVHAVQPAAGVVASVTAKGMGFGEPPTCQRCEVRHVCVARDGPLALCFRCAVNVRNHVKRDGVRLYSSAEAAARGWSAALK